jgi:hypothetical protein
MSLRCLLAMMQIRILEQHPLKDIDGYWAECAYDESGRRIRVEVSGPALVRLQRFEADLADVLEQAILFALRSGQCEGTVDVSGESPTERHLTVIFRSRQEEGRRKSFPPQPILSFWIHNQAWEIRLTADGYEYRSNTEQPWQQGTPPGATEMQIAILFAKLSGTGRS